MNRRITNIIRYCMDELIPPFIRDSKVFMYPFYYIAYRGNKIKDVMQFKSKVYSFTNGEYDNFYNNLNTISRNRTTDLNNSCVNFILDHLTKDDKNLIDIGSGRGFLLKEIGRKYPHLELYGFDIKNPDGSEPYKAIKGNIEKLPFSDKQFDVVTCCHTVEHLINLDLCISELKRITAKKLIIVTPKQRYYYYTLDEHVNFFPFKEKLTSVLNIEKHECYNLDGDWAYIGYL